MPWGHLDFRHFDRPEVIFGRPDRPRDAALAPAVQQGRRKGTCFDATGLQDQRGILAGGRSGIGDGSARAPQLIPAHINPHTGIKMGAMPAASNRYITIQRWCRAQIFVIAPRFKETLGSQPTRFSHPIQGLLAGNGDR